MGAVQQISGLSGPFLTGGFPGQVKLTRANRDGRDGMFQRKGFLFFLKN